MRYPLSTEKVYVTTQAIMGQCVSTAQMVQLDIQTKPYLISPVLSWAAKAHIAVLNIQKFHSS